MKRAGFTMIELIFVIVILGILAAVAIPKLAATRTDAEVVKIATETATLVSDLGAYYTSQGTFSGKKITDITNVDMTLVTGTSGALADPTSFHIQDDSSNNCLLVTFNKVADGNVSIAYVSKNQKSNVCVQACSANDSPTKKFQTTYIFGGSRINFK